jgi:choline dehydrogenase
MMYKVRNVRTLNERANNLVGKALMGLEYLLLSDGAADDAAVSATAFAKSDPAQSSANIEWHVQPLSLDKFGEPLHPFPAINPSVCNLRPTSRGSVRITGPDPLAHSAIRPNYLAMPEDQQVVMDAMRFTRRNMAARALARFEPEEWRPGRAVESDTELLRAAEDLGTTIFHPVGTCRTRWRSSTTSFASTASRGSGWSTRRSCPGSPRTTRTRRR